MHAGSHPRSRAQGAQPPLQWAGSGFFCILFSAPPPHRPPGGGSRGRGQGPGSSSNSSSTWRGARPEAASRAPSPAHTPTCPGAPSPTSSSSPSLGRHVRTTAPPTLCQAMANHHPPPATEKLTTFRRGFFRVPPVQRRRGQDTRMRAGPFARTPKKHQKQRQKTRQEEAAKQGVTDRIVSGPGP